MDQSRQIILVTGSTIGKALAEAYATDPHVETVYYTYHRHQPVFAASNILAVQVDLTREPEVADCLGSLERLDGVFNTLGFLHGEDHQPEKSIGRFSPEGLMRSIELNTLPTALLAKHSRSLLRRSPSSFFAAISAKVGSIEDNQLGGWYSYRSSKAALNMLLKTLAIEWRIALPNCRVAALHPGTVESPLSAPFTRNNPSLKTPAESAACLKKILDDLSPADSGRFWAWDGTPLPW